MNILIINPQISSSPWGYFHLSSYMLFGYIHVVFMGLLEKKIFAGKNVLTSVQFQIGSSLDAPPAFAEDIDFPAS